MLTQVGRDLSCFACHAAMKARYLPFALLAAQFVVLLAGSRFLGWSGERLDGVPPLLRHWEAPSRYVLAGECTSSMLGVLSVDSMKLLLGGWTGPPPVSAAAARRQSPGRNAREPVLCAE